MSPILFNRKDPTDIVDSGHYQVPWDEELHIGYPLKENGTLEVEDPSPPYTIYQAVSEYSDDTSVAATIGVSEDQIQRGDTIEASALKNIEFRHFRRDVAVCKFGIRAMRNKSNATVQTGTRVAPYPGGFTIWTTGMAILGVVNRGPIADEAVGEIKVDPEFIST